MPCRDDRAECEPQDLEEQFREYREKLEKEFRHNGYVAEMLCDVLGEIEDLDKRLTNVLNFKLLDRVSSPATAKWWVAHKKRDEKRLEHEKALAKAKKRKDDEESRKELMKIKALAKLTVAEREALGFRGRR